MNQPASLAATSRLAISYRAVTDLIPDPRNARTHPKRQIEQIKASIAAFGFTNPILAAPDGHIIAGHGRLQAARAMGLAEVPVIALSGLSETQKRALRIADNKIALNAGWDLEILQLELSELASLDVDIDPTLTGFTTGEIDLVLSSTDDPDDEVRRLRSAQVHRKTDIIYLCDAGHLSLALEPLRMAKILDARRETARMVIAPWLVQAALARLDRKLSPTEQRVVVD